MVTVNSQLDRTENHLGDSKATPLRVYLDYVN